MTGWLGTCPAAITELAWFRVSAQCVRPLFSSIPSSVLSWNSCPRHVFGFQETVAKYLIYLNCQFSESWLSVLFSSSDKWGVFLFVHFLNYYYKPRFLCGWFVSSKTHYSWCSVCPLFGQWDLFQVGPWVLSTQHLIVSFHRWQGTFGPHDTFSLILSHGKWCLKTIICRSFPWTMLGRVLF